MHPSVMEAWRTKAIIEAELMRAAYHIDKPDDWKGFVEAFLGIGTPEDEKPKPLSLDEQRKLVAEIQARREAEREEAENARLVALAEAHSPTL